MLNREAIVRAVKERTHILAGIFLGAAFLYPQMWWVALIGVVFLCYGIAQSVSYRQAIIRSALAGALKGTIATVWFMNAFPADWIGDVGRAEQFVFILFCWLGTGISTGLGYAVIGMCVHATRHYALTVRAFIFGCALVCAEVAGSLLFSIYTLAPVSAIDANFGFGMTGFLLADHRFLQAFALLGGVYALTFCMGFVGYFLYEQTLKFGLHRGALFLLILLATSVLHGPHAWKTVTPPQLVATVETEFDAYRSMTDSELLARQTALMEGASAGLTSGAGIVLLPEDARFGIGTEPNVMASRLSAVSHVPGALVIDSYRTQIARDAVVLRGYQYDLDAKRTYISEKQYMVPVGEFMPILHGSLATALNGADLFEHMRYVPGTLELDESLPPSVPAMLYCFESGATPVIRKKMIAREAELIVHPVSHAWFHTPRTLWNQERQILIVQSIYTRTPILQAGNMAPNALYLPDGTVDSGTVIASGPRWKTILFGT